LEGLDLPKDDRLIQGFEHGADAAIYKLSEDLALVFTADFFTPVVNDPFVFGQIAAANSLADIYTCGAKPLMALNLVCFPEKDLPKEIIKEMLRGGIKKVKEAGALLVGGHSVDDKEPKYGLAVLGTVHPDKVIKNSSASPGDLIYISKPIGTGILITAFKGGLFDESSPLYGSMIETMTELNNKVAELMTELEIKAATDVSGFGLLGHASEMALASKKSILIKASEVPFISGVKEFVEMGIIPEGDYKNLNYSQRFVDFHEDVSEVYKILLSDAQTSGGLLICVPPHKKDEFETRGLEKGIFTLKCIGEVLDLAEGECPRVKVIP